MAKLERMNDRWKCLRLGLYGNIEPEVTLKAVTVPVYRDITAVTPEYEDLAAVTNGEPHVSWTEVEEIPALAASVSYGAEKKIAGSRERALALNRSLIQKGHLTPLESIQLNLAVSGISKTCGAQVSRHRIGQGHVGASRRFRNADVGFVYTAFEKLGEAEAICELQDEEAVNRFAFSRYLSKRNRGITKQEARAVLPVSYATKRDWWINVRALRDFFRLRLAADAEWEVRRLAWMIYDLIQPKLPSLFYDFEERIDSDS